MRFKLTLENQNKGLLPLNYQHGLSAWIYKTLNQGNTEFAEWLHREGYVNDYKQFKLFSFSRLLVPEFSIEGDRMRIRSSESGLIVSFYPIQSLEYFVSGLFNNQSISIGDKKAKAEFIVRTVEKVPEPEFKADMEFKTLSPVLISYKYSKKQRYARYMHPGDELYGDLLVKNLSSKYHAFYAKEKVSDTGIATGDGLLDNTENINYSFELLSKPKSRLVTIKSGTPQESKLRGYLYRFRLRVPKELIRLGYYAGFGEKNSLGFGCTEVG